LSQSVVTISNLCHVYSGAEGADGLVLQDVSLEIDPGDFVAIRGRSGSGKSTLLNIIGGILPPTRGKVIVAGQDLFRLDDAALSAFRGRTIGFVFQSYHLSPPLTAQENVMVPALLAGQSIELARKAAVVKLREVGLEAKAQTRPAELSGGQMQRVALARALINNPTIVLADEPTGNLDEHTGAEILELLGRYHRERRVTIIMATHDESVERHATHHLHLAEGRLTGPGTEGQSAPAAPSTEAAS
jgi:ABC-type lipoprotein export system ATPase subunit